MFSINELSACCSRGRKRYSFRLKFFLVAAYKLLEPYSSIYNRPPGFKDLEERKGAGYRWNRRLICVIERFLAVHDIWSDSDRPCGVRGRTQRTGVHNGFIWGRRCRFTWSRGAVFSVKELPDRETISCLKGMGIAYASLTCPTPHPHSRLLRLHILFISRIDPPVGVLLGEKRFPQSSVLVPPVTDGVGARHAISRR